MSTPRILDIRELKLVRDTNGAVLGGDESGQDPIWVQDIVFTALTLYDLNGEANKEITRLQRAMSKIDSEICQTLGQVLGYPWFMDDPKNFPNATKADGVCVGEHVAESIAMHAARRIKELTGALQWMVDDETDAEQDRNPVTGDMYDSVRNARTILLDKEGDL